jgi:lysozyme
MAKVNQAPWDGKGVPLTVPLAATAVVRRLEGFSATPYDDNGSAPGGTWTIGYGSIIDGNEKAVTPQTPAITEEEAVKLLQRDMRGAALAVARRVKSPLNEGQAASLISWTYNLGEGSLAKSTMLTLLNSGKFDAVPDEMRKWVHHEGKVLLGLLRRRWVEAAIFCGMDATDACTLAWKTIDSVDDWPALQA